MGFRTVVVLSNDSGWMDDKDLGKKIWEAACRIDRDGDGYFHGQSSGQVVECVHADAESLIFTGGYSGERAAITRWNHDYDKVKLELIREVAAQLGYKLIKDSKKKVV